jgi:hypothetical protein
MPAVAAPPRWPPLEITRIEQKLNELAALLEDEIREEPSGPVPAWLARLLVVRSCGFLEQVVLIVSQTFVTESSWGYVRTFARSAIPVSRNPSPEKLLEWVGRFATEWEVDLRTTLDDDDERLGRELAFLVDRRNKIAHGLNEGITGRKALDLKIVAGEVADWFLLRFNPTG